MPRASLSFQAGWGRWTNCSKLVQTRKVTSFPIVLLGVDFWGPMIEWIKGTLVAEGMVSEKDLDLIQVVDDAADAVDRVLHGTVQVPSNGEQRPE
jgi:predicted Rossmann-fold nucleotide-binding protein